MNTALLERPVAKRPFLGLDFDIMPRADWLRLLARAGKVTPFQYIVTPNVDHTNGFHDGVVPEHVYRGAGYTVCDSRILATLAKLQGVDVAPYPGSDMVREFMADPRSKDLRIGLFGPSQADFEALKAVYPGHAFLWIEAPMLKPGTPAWDEAVQRLLAAPFDLLLCCISFPKQEQMCFDLKAAGRERGLALCAGASLDFLIGKQVRAPGWMRTLHIEWLHRLLSDPRRMAYRYLVRGPRILLHMRRQGPTRKVSKSN